MPASSKINITALPADNDGQQQQQQQQQQLPTAQQLQDSDGIVKVVGQLRAPPNVVEIFACAFNEDATKMLYGTGRGAIYLVETKPSETPDDDSRRSSSRSTERSSAPSPMRTSHQAAAAAAAAQPLFKRRAAESRILRKISIDNAPITCIRCAHDSKARETFYAVSSDGCVYRSAVGANSYNGDFELFVPQQEENELHCIDVSPIGDQFCTAGKNASVYHHDRNGRLVHEYKSTETLASGFDVGVGGATLNGGSGTSPVPNSANANAKAASNTPAPPPAATMKAIDTIARPGGRAVAPAVEMGRGVGHSNRIFGLKWNPRSHFVVMSGGWDNCIKIWDIRTREGVVRSIFGPHVRGADALDFSHGQLLTASLTAHDALQLWDYGSGRLIKSIPFCGEQGLYCFQYYTEEVFEVIGTRFVLKNVRCSATDKEYLYAARFYGTKCVIAGGSGQNMAKVFHLYEEKLNESTRCSSASQPTTTPDVAATCVGNVMCNKLVNTIDVCNGQFVIPAQPDRILICSLDASLIGSSETDKDKSSTRKQQQPQQQQQYGGLKSTDQLWNVRRETLHEKDKLKTFGKTENQSQSTTATPSAQPEQQQEKSMHRSHRFSHDRGTPAGAGNILEQRPSVKDLFDKWDAK